MAPLRLVVALAMLGVSFTVGASDFAYNKGVDAFQAKKYEEAFRHWADAASHGSIDALNNLGFLLYNGFGVTKDQEAAIELWQTAGRAGHSEAQWHLADAYETGVGVGKDRPRAYAWYRCAIASATWKLDQTEDQTERFILKDAKESLSKLTPSLSKQDLARGDVLASECVQRYGKPAL